MNQASIAKLEALLARVTARRAEPRLQVVTAAAPALSEPRPVAPLGAEPPPVAQPEVAALAQPAHEPPQAVAVPEPLASEPAALTLAAAQPEAAVILVPEVPAGLRAGDGAPPTPSVIDALAAIRPEALAGEEPPARGPDFAIARPVLERGRPSMPTPSEHELDVEEPDEPTVAVAVPNLRALHPELTLAGEPTLPAAQQLPEAALPEATIPEATIPEAQLPEPADEPVLELAKPASPPDQPRVSVPPPRMSLPVRPSLPSPELVPEALPFTLLTERPPALPSEQESLELAAIALSTTPVINLASAGPVRVELQQPLSDLIEVSAEADLARASAAVTVVPTASSAPPTGRDAAAPVIPPALAPAIEPIGGMELEPDPRLRASEPTGEAIRAQLPSLSGSAVTVTSTLPTRSPATFGRLLARSLALRPRS